MRVCHICSNYDKFFVDLMEEQISQGIDLRVFYFRARERGLPNVKAPYLDIRLNYSNWDRPFFFLKEKKVLEDFFNIYIKDQFDLLHAHTLFSNGYIALEAKKRWGIPYIVAVRDVDVNVFLKYRINLRKLGIEILKEAERIIYLSKSYLNIVHSKYIPKELQEDFIKKSHIIPNGINRFFLDNRYYRNGLPKNKTLNIITVGYISKRKNQLTVCKAVKALNDSGIKSKYTVIGKILDQKVFKKISSYSFVNYIPFLSKEDLIKEYRNADIYVMPSLTETFGLTYVEAMSQGLPVIYSKGQGFDSQFEEGMVGYHVNSRDVNEIKSRIIDIVENYNTFSKNCTDLSTKFNWKDITNEYKNIYNDVIKR